MQILEELYYGNIHPNAKLYRENDSLTELIHLRKRNLENLLKHLNEEEKEILEKLSDAEEEMSEILQYEKFSYGFRLGILLMAEVVSGMEQMIADG